MADRRREGNEKSWPARAVLVRGDQRYRGGAADGDADDHVCKHRHREGVFAFRPPAHRRLGCDGGVAAGVAGFHRERNQGIVLTPA